MISTEDHGVSIWASTGRIDVELADGTLQSFFIKVISKDVGKNMVHGEFESMKAIHTLLPCFAPKPIAWGTYETIMDTHFFLCQYREMIDEMPDPYKFTALLADLHENSESTNGKFGIHITTYCGNLPQTNEWETSWETYFTKNMRWALKLELEAKGPNPELDILVPALFDKVIPRHLRPLESEGRFVKPSLVHGDLWYANSGIDVGTGESLIFDACSFYAHNECKSKEPSGCNSIDDAHMLEDEFGQWRPICNRFGAEYLAAYRSYIRVSPPVEDYDGRLDLYKL